MAGFGSEERLDPPPAGDEAANLIGFADFLRHTIRVKSDGLDAEQLGRTLPPSSMTLGGMLKHLAYVEDQWFGRVFLGRDAAPPFDAVDWSADNDWDWHSAADDSPEALRDLWTSMVDRSRKVTADALAGPEGLDTLSALPGLDGERVNLRFIVTHMIEEYGRHAGHADLIRESIDGATGE